MRSFVFAVLVATLTGCGEAVTAPRVVDGVAKNHATGGYHLVKWNGNLPALFASNAQKRDSIIGGDLTYMAGEAWTLVWQHRVTWGTDSVTAYSVTSRGPTGPGTLIFPGPGNSVVGFANIRISGDSAIVTCCNGGSGERYEFLR